MNAKPLSKAMRRLLNRAAGRQYGYVCPTPELWGHAQTLALDALERRGLIIPNDGAPVISDAGRAAVEA